MPENKRLINQESKMLKRLLFPLTLLLCLAVATTSCRDDDDGLIDLPEELVSGPIRISVPENPWRIKSAADYYAFYVECQGSGWIATCESEWLTLTPTGGSESQYIRFDVGENMEPFARVAVITIADAKEPDTYRVQVRIRQSGYNDEDNATLTGDMQKKHRMGYGYDIMKEYASDGSYSDNPVLDYDKVVEAEEAKGITIISEDRRHYQDLEIFSGTTITELAGKLTRNMDSKATFLGCGKISDTKTDIYRNKTIEEVCGLVRLKQIISSRTIDIGMLRSQATSDDSPLYSKEFRNALRELNENNVYTFFEKFGTHLVVSADLGGSLELHTTITRETSIETEHSVTTVTKKVFGKNNGSSSQTYDAYQKEIGIDYKADLSCVGGVSDTYGAMQAAVNAKRQITPAEIKTWQASFNIDPTDAGKNYNVGMIGCRLIPIYEIINDPDKRRAVQAAFAKYTNSPEMAPKPIEDPARIETGVVRRKWEKDQNPFSIKVTDAKGTKRALFAKEYVPAIRRDALVTVAYPVVNGKAYFYSGIFIGDAEHNPGVVRWLGNNGVYEENDSISYDNSRFAGLFDSNKALKQLYFYETNVHILPPTKNDAYMADKDISNEMSIETVCIKDISMYSDVVIPLVKVGPWLWTESCKCSIDILPTINRKNGQKYVFFHGESHDFYNAYIYWIEYDMYLPRYSQAESLIKVCNGNLGILFDTDENGRNWLGLTWLKGFVATSAGKESEKDMQAYVIPVTIGSVIRIARLTPSGRATNFRSTDYFNGMFNSPYALSYLPVFLTTREVR